MVVPKCWWVACNPSMIMEPRSCGNVSRSEIKRWGSTVLSATAGRRVREK